MGDIYEERKRKIERIIEEYDKRKTQAEIAKEFSINERYVSLVTQEYNYRHTRKITPENIKDGEKINPITFMDKFGFLDKYPMENFTKHDGQIEN